MRKAPKQECEHVECIAELRDIAHARGWNGVENSKILEVFLHHYLIDLENALSFALEYLAHPEMSAIPFTLSPTAFVSRWRDQLANVKKEEARLRCLRPKA